MKASVLALLLLPLGLNASPLAIEFRGDLSASEQDKLRHWLEQSADTLSLVSGRFPLEQARITVTPTQRGYGPVPWARVIRSQPEGIHFYVDPSYPADAYHDDWTALHEFSHLLIPYPGDDDIWFSEGLASYYQNLLRGRAGVVSVEQALRDLDAGFQRGERDANRKGRSLRQLSPAMWRTGSYMRVYWSGAAYFMRVDMALREQHNVSLDTVLARFIECCRQQRRSWTAQSLIATFDQLADTTLFADHYRQVIDDTAFPELASVYQNLGLERHNGRLKFNPAEEFDQRRQSLFRAPTSSP
ncbi:hypothetical protein KUW19_18950 [Ferrimonas balearica]|uniref:M61 family metallopeptidase n=1 Tax=Ferrimonas balearica TaxID=44012 RepID=UPI001C955E68|nr:hypothetical protein [Ferrimonas balearica]MBY6108545.1 hypothetical protein [Ferrimonas balearica]